MTDLDRTKRIVGRLIAEAEAYPDLFGEAYPAILREALALLEAMPA